jgi:hypothetical protein
MTNDKMADAFARSLRFIAGGFFGIIFGLTLIEWTFVAVAILMIDTAFAWKKYRR